jgi:hypothetical protein
LGGLYAALKRRSFTVVLAVLDVSSILVKIKGEVRGDVESKVTGRVEGDGQECPSQTGNPTPTAPVFARWTAGGSCPHMAGFWG